MENNQFSAILQNFIPIHIKIKSYLNLTVGGGQNKNPNIGRHRRRLHHAHAISRYARIFELLTICVNSEKSCLIESMVRL